MFARNQVLPRLRQASQRKYVTLAVFCGAVVFGSRLPVWAVAPPAEVDGSKVYEQRCAACHNGNVPRAPQLNVLRQKNPEDILGALLTGPMTFLGMGMPDAERRAVAEYIAGKPLGEEQLKATATNLCSQAPGEFSVSDRDPHWNGWGASLANTRFQAAEHAGLSAQQVPNLKLKWAFGYPMGTVA